MKPIFKQEKEFLEELLNIKLPNNCWRDGSSIYVNPNTKPAIIRFKVDGIKSYIVKNRLIDFDNNTVTIEINKNKIEVIKNNTLEEEYDLNKDHIENLLQESIDKTKEYIINHPNIPIRVSISGGKDSDVMYYILKNYIFPNLNMSENDYTLDVFNTTNDTADTYRHILQDLKIDRKFIHNPSKGWSRWLKEDKNYFLPSVMVRNCCSTYKEGQAKKLLDKNKEYLSLLGMRKYESAKRSNYDWDLNEAIKRATKKLNCPENWYRFLPIVNWRDEDIWLFIIHNKVKVNHMYSLGFNRCGCLICPYSSDYNDLLIRKYYPLLWDNWTKMVNKNYDLYGVEKRLKWTREEWINGKWKQGMSKEYELTQLKPTKERIEEVAKIKGISKNMAKKYFQKKCVCGKKLNPDEIAMFLKLNGRYENVEDDRDYLCKKCLCEKLNITPKEYQEQVHSFRNQGCTLF